MELFAQYYPLEDLAFQEPSRFLTAPHCALLYRVIGKGQAHIIALVVEPEHRKKGKATMLINTLKIMYSTLTANVLFEEINTYFFWEKQGFSAKGVNNALQYLELEFSK